MCKSSTLAFVLIFAFLFKLEKPSWKLILIIVIITAGVILMVSDETDFNLVGFIQVMAASAFGGLRWSLTEVLLRKESMGLTNPFASIFFLAPAQAIILLIISAIVEGYITIFTSPFFATFAIGSHTVSNSDKHSTSFLNICIDWYHFSRWQSCVLYDHVGILFN